MKSVEQSGTHDGWYMGFNISYTERQEILECYAWMWADENHDLRLYLSVAGYLTPFSTQRIESSFAIIRQMIDSYVNKTLIEDYYA